MQTRRQLLQQALTIPLVLNAHQPANNLEIICDRDLLSRESAAGYRLLLKHHRSRQIIIIAAVSQMNERRLRDIASRAQQGAWLIWEAPTYTCEAVAAHYKWLEETFGISPQPPREVNQARTLYLEYRWPTNALVRTFSSITPISCPPSEAIAHYENEPVAIRKSTGRGGIVFLGSMLGPHLSAGDTEAHALGKQLLQLTSS